MSDDLLQNLCREQIDPRSIRESVDAIAVREQRDTDLYIYTLIF